MKNIIVITGQTGTGKTSLALKLAHEKNGELINADSRQIYKYLDIITGKDIPLNSKFQIINSNQFDIGYYLLDSIKLWLYDVVDPKEYFSSYDFKVYAEKVIEDILSRGKIPIIIGGTYLYIKHLLYSFETENIPPDWLLRKKLNTKPVSELADMLRSINEQMFKDLNNSDKKNPQRLIRKIEIALYASKKPEVQLQINPTGCLALNLRNFIGLRFSSNEKLAQTIKKRVEERLKNGALEEVLSLLKKGYAKDNPGLKTIGYQQLIDYLQGRKNKQEAIEEWILCEIQYAKRQYTFMKKDKNITWYDV